ncbi:MAG: hypothetical protein ACOX55_04700 [Christensenellales bacterium]|jgi:hypothetical protein
MMTGLGEFADIQIAQAEILSVGAEIKPLHLATDGESIVREGMNHYET